MLKATIALERKVTGERTNTGALLFLYEFVPLAAPPRKNFPQTRRSEPARRLLTCQVFIVFPVAL